MNREIAAASMIIFFIFNLLVVVVEQHDKRLCIECQGEGMPLRCRQGEPAKLPVLGDRLKRPACLPLLGDKHTTFLPDRVIFAGSGTVTEDPPGVSALDVPVDGKGILVATSLV